VNGKAGSLQNCISWVRFPLVAWHENKENKLEILIYPNPRLREEARRVKSCEIMTPDFRKRCWDMLRAMEESAGMGLAATQVGWDARVFVMKNKDGMRRICINPEWVQLNEAKWSPYEGCLSFPDKVTQVERYRNIRLLYTDITASMRHEIFTDIDAQCVQHETEHLEGILFIDHVEPNEIVKRRNENETV
jgi:peptide deformylase